MMIIKEISFLSSFLADNNIKKGVYSAITFSSYEQNDKPKGWAFKIAL